ncbi:proteasome activator [Euzebya tangerina]|uniref:proteasome activator n=1 Tax=Euzebya tangerina TaxID=591198 RepID=UPI000E31EE0C|nr:proteasome activator [Euzebya tangerina]
MVEQVEVVEDDEPEAAAEGEDSPEPMITEPGKLMRIAVMLREVQGEARRADADEGGRSMLRQVHERAMAELCDVLSSDLQDELSQFSFEFDSDAPSQSEILIAQAQLIGWLEGLFQGIQAAIFNQQAAAQKQLEAMRQRGLPQGRPAGPGQDQRSGGDSSPGNYL